jgi:hypothetical protein
VEQIITWNKPEYMWNKNLAAIKGILTTMEVNNPLKLDRKDSERQNLK